MNLKQRIFESRIHIVRNEEVEAPSEEVENALDEIETTLDAIAPGETLGGFFARFIGGSLEQGVAIFEDVLKFFRWRRQIRLMVRTEDFMREVGLENPSRHIPLNFAIHLFEGASLEENDELQDRWAALLVNWANANSGTELDRAYISVLLQINPPEAQILEKIYSLPYGKTQLMGVTVSDLRKEMSLTPEGEPKNGDPIPDVELALSNLARLSCIGFSNSWGEGAVIDRVLPTLFGKRFSEAWALQRK